MSSMPENSFQFGEYNSLNDLGIFCEAYDTLLPPKRSRKIEIPGRDGLYDFGSETYGERTIVLKCKLIEQITKAQLREVAYKLSDKKKLILWDEPDKYYVAELFDPTEIDNIADRLWLEFDLTFTCEPFAYTETKDFSLRVGPNDIDYGGTAKTPTLITLHNANAYEVSNITITAIKRKKG